MGDKTKKPRDKKKLEINKETVKELTDQELDQVAGGGIHQGPPPQGEGVRQVDYSAGCGDATVKKK
jgi:bacteriocin-like protein